MSRYDFNDTSDYADFEAMFDPIHNDRQARRKRKPKAKHKPKKDQRAIIEEIADTSGLEGGFETTYKLSLFEQTYLLDALRPFYEQEQIVDVLAIVKGGKEANVYRCEAHPTTGAELYAAKVYRPRTQRQIRNDSVYKEGREIIGPDGTALQEKDKRAFRALAKGTNFGTQLAHTSWMMHEFNTLQRLYEAGASVPRPITAGENAILMGYVGDEHMAAPTLSGVDLDPDEAEMLFNDVLYNIDLMLRMDIIHGDLSAYNILYWDGEITLIDFPQVISGHSNSSAYDILLRDVTRVCEYFNDQGLSYNPEHITDQLWSRYLAVDPKDRQADLSRFEIEAEND